MLWELLYNNKKNNDKLIIMFLKHSLMIKNILYDGYTKVISKKQDEANSTINKPLSNQYKTYTSVTY